MLTYSMINVCIVKVRHHPVIRQDPDHGIEFKTHSVEVTEEIAGRNCEVPYEIWILYVCLYKNPHVTATKTPPGFIPVKYNPQFELQLFPKDERES